VKRTICALGMVLAVLSASSQAANDAKEDPAHEELRTLLKESVAAYNAADLDKLLTYLDDDVIVVWQNATLNRGKKEVKAYIEEMTKGPNRRVEKSTIAPTPGALSILHNDGKMAVAFGHSRDHYLLIDGTEFDQDTSWTATLVKKDGKWKTTSIHISTNMFDNPVLNLAVKKTALWAGGVAGGIALLLGLLVGFFLGRSRKKA
jgi:ketosteroid isomerase-like protein